MQSVRVQGRLVSGGRSAEDLKGQPWIIHVLTPKGDLDQSYSFTNLDDFQTVYELEISRGQAGTRVTMFIPTESFVLE